MMQDCVVAILDDMQELAEALQRLSEAEVPSDSVSIITRSVEQDEPEGASSLQTGDEAKNRTRRGAMAGSALGAIAGGSLLFIPGVGTLLATGAFAGALTGGIVGGYLGSLQGWGVHKDHVAQYDQRLREGKVIAVVHGDPLIVARATRVLRERFENVRLHMANSGDAPELFRETANKPL